MARQWPGDVMVLKLANTEIERVRAGDLRVAFEKREAPPDTYAVVEVDATLHQVPFAGAGESCNPQVRPFATGTCMWIRPQRSWRQERSS